MIDEDTFIESASSKTTKIPDAKIFKMIGEDAMNDEETKIAPAKMIGEDTFIDEDTMKKADAKIIGEDTMDRQNVACPQIIGEDAMKKCRLQKVPAATNGHATAGRAGIENGASDTNMRYTSPNVCAKPHFPGMLEAGPAT